MTSAVDCFALGEFTVLCAAMMTDSGTFGVGFKIYANRAAGGEILHVQEWPAPGPTYSTVAEAIRAGRDLAIAWIEATARRAPEAES